jgi:hypothetical protein
MARIRQADSSIVLPWERRGGLVRRLGLSRARPLLLTLSVVVLFVIIGIREHRAAGVRATRASLWVVRESIDRFRADNAGRCPSDLSDLEKKNYLPRVPTDAWGHPFILTCPGRFDTDGYELSSAGPDGEPGGLDRIE